MIRVEQLGAIGIEERIERIRLDIVVRFQAMVVETVLLFQGALAERGARECLEFPNDPMK